MSELLNKIDRENKIFYLIGNFNIDLLQSETCDIANKFSEQLFTSCFLSNYNKPTRITEHTATLIDNIFTNNIENTIHYTIQTWWQHVRNRSRTEIKVARIQIANLYH